MTPNSVPCVPLARELPRASISSCASSIYGRKNGDRFCGQSLAVDVSLSSRTLLSQLRQQDPWGKAATEP